MSQTIRKNFIYPNIPVRTRIFGAVHDIGIVINESGDWRGFVPPEEYQMINGIESSSCYIQAQVHSIATILERQYGIADKDFAERFNALLSNGTPYGGDPLLGAESIRNDGLINYDLMPFSDDIESWQDYHSWKSVNEIWCRKKGKEFLETHKLNYDIVIERENAVEDKYTKLKEKLKRSPVAISVYGQTDSNGNYVPKPNGVNDTHMVEAVYVDNDNCIWIWDTYTPFLKKLPSNYNPDFGMMWGVELKAKPVKTPLFERFAMAWRAFFAWFNHQRLVFREFKIHYIDYLKNKNEKNT